MSTTYRYTDISENQIRVLWLYPAPNKTDPLECRIAICNRNESPAYEALSYVWGADDGPLTQLKVHPTPETQSSGNRFFLIRPNLALALRRESCL